jgi:serine/threonine protein kinase
MPSAPLSDDLSRAHTPMAEGFVTVAELLAARGPLPVAEAVAIVALAGEALHAAHEQGVVCRTLTAESVLVNHAAAATAVQVLGIDSERGAAAAAGPPPRDWADPAAAAFLAPEQVRVGKTVDRRADLWALGVLLYQSLTGNRPFPGDDYRSVTSGSLIDEPRPMGLARDDVPAGLASIVLRCLEKTPTRRFATARELLDALVPFAPEVAGPAAARCAERDGARPAPTTGVRAGAGSTGEARRAYLRRLAVAATLGGLLLLAVALALCD